MLTALFGERFMPGGDSFYTLLRRHRLMLPPRKARGTTNSNHRYHKWKNLIKGFVPTSPNQLWVSDITYIPLAGGDVCYLHLVTDAYSHKIVGWVLADSLRASATLEALRQAIDQAVEMTGSENLERLRRHGIAISMTEDYKTTDNAVAERINGIIKVERLYRQGLFETIERAASVIERYIYFYNYRRPHMSVGYKTPGIVHGEKETQIKMWRNKRKPVKSNEKERDTIALQSRTTNLSEGLCSAQR